MRQAGAEITTSESILFQLLGMFISDSGSADHPQFKSISRLIVCACLTQRETQTRTAQALAALC